jgi:putative transposase
MNLIELEWQHIKKNELSGQIFDDELDLAYAVISAVQGTHVNTYLYLGLGRG